MSKSFKELILENIRKIPKGRVASYGQIAAQSGSPRAARQVGGILARITTDDQIPWWRVINNKGQISIKGNWVYGKETQAVLLRKEGIEVDKEFKINIRKYRA